MMKQFQEAQKNPPQMSEYNWENIKFRASSWGNLLTDPVTKSAKEAGELSITCQKELIKIYNQEVYGRKRDITTKHMDKGIQCEAESINLFSIVEGVIYFKNQCPLENEWFTGHPDIGDNEDIRKSTEVNDIKTSWDLDTFMPKLIEEPDKSYIAQLNVYFDLTGAQGGNIVYCLVSAPQNILEQEKRSLLFKMNVATEYAPEYIKSANELEKLMIFEDIDYRERVIKIPVARNDELIQKMKDKVPILRAWLKNFHEKHMQQYPK
jgi:hypothetical protein